MYSQSLYVIEMPRRRSLLCQDSYFTLYSMQGDSLINLAIHSTVTQSVINFVVDDLGFKNECFNLIWHTFNLLLWVFFKVKDPHTYNKKCFLDLLYSTPWHMRMCVCVCIRCW